MGRRGPECKAPGGMSSCLYVRIDEGFAKRFDTFMSTMRLRYPYASRSDIVRIVLNEAMSKLEEEVDAVDRD